MHTYGLCQFLVLLLTAPARCLSMRTSVKVVFFLGGITVFVLIYLTCLVKFSADQPVPIMNQNWGSVRNSLNFYNNTKAYRDVTPSVKTAERNLQEETLSNITAKERARRLQDKCRQLQKRGYRKLFYAPRFNHTPKLDIFRRFIADDHYALMYCPIEKVGCSFWKRVFFLLKDHKNTSVFDLSGVKIHRLRGLTNVNSKLLMQTPKFIESAKKFLFVRDPYERLFSGFMDKIFTHTYETPVIARFIKKTVFFPRKHARTFRKGLNDPILGARKHTDISRGDLFRANETLRNSPARMENDAGEHIHERSEEGQSDVDTSAKRVDHLRDVRDNEVEEVHNTEPNLYLKMFQGMRLRTGNTGPDLYPENMLLRKNRSLDSYHRPEVEKRTTPRKPCKMKVTFAEFVQYVLNDRKVNTHFVSMSRRCPPCVVPYDFVGNMETFRRDVSHILASVGVDLANISRSDFTFDQDSDLNILHDVTERTFSVISGYTSCITRAESLRRTWITFQVRGYISLSQEFPLSDGKASRVTKDQFLDLVNKAYAHSGPREVRMRQRKVAMLEAFYSLPRDLLKSLEAYFERDCLLFGYECSISQRFSPDKKPEPVFHFEKFMEHVSNSHE